jgi:heme exporter protein C
MIKKHAYKIAAVALLIYALIGGLLGPVPKLPILNETVRNLYFHVPMWFTMIYLLLISFIYAVKYLKNSKIQYDMQSEAYASVGMLFGILGILTGSIWAKFTWGAFWTNDPKLNASAIGLLMYLAYFVLRASVEDNSKRARIAAVYNIFSYFILVPLLFVLPRLTDSLHPGNGGNPGFNSYDLDSNMRTIFYPAVVGWICLGIWIANLTFRIKKLNQAQYEN